MQTERGVLFSKPWDMSIKAAWCKHTLNFKFLAGTSRGTLEQKDSYFLKLWNESNPSVFGIGEAGPLKGLSAEFSTVENEIVNLCFHLNNGKEVPTLSSSLLFAYETALLGLKNGAFNIIFENSFIAKGEKIPINGLIWMGNEDFMKTQISKKLDEGYTTIKLKIGAISYHQELGLIANLRKQFNSKDLTIRVDANGAFEYERAKQVLEDLKKYEVHSIEQPIKAGQFKEMADLCKNGATDIALDEELIGVENKEEVLQSINPAYIILKPSLHGGITGTKEWISIAQKNHIKWWMTSALESNIGLNAVCQLCAEYKNPLPQGLGTGQLYHNNLTSPLYIDSGFIEYSPNEKWDLSVLNFN